MDLGLGAKTLRCSGTRPSSSAARARRRASINLLDVRVSKAIRFGGTTKLDLMAQAFNLLNTRNLQAQYGGGRVTNSLSDGFGRILTARPGRQAELALRLLW